MLYKKGLKILAKIILILGGARSGKSTFAEKIAKKLGGEQVSYIATAEALDQEMQERIELHQSQRSKKWDTIEEPKEVSKVIKRVENSRTILIDCLTLFISNLLLEKENLKNENNLEIKNKLEDEIINEVKEIIDIARKKHMNLIIVSNEVGQGLVPSYELGRLFRDISGRANQMMAQKADKVYLTIAGFALDLNELNKNNQADILKDLGEG